MTRIVQRLRHHRDAQAGFTLIELSVTVILMGIVSVILLTTLTTIVRTSTETDRKSLTTAEARLAMERMARDLRAANPLDAIVATLPTSTYDREISFKVFCTGGIGCVSGLRPVKYSVSGSTLTQAIGSSPARTLLGPSESPTLPDAMRRGAILNTTAQPVFTYFNKHGVQLATNTTVGAGLAPSNFRDCAKRVVIHLLVRANPNEARSVIDLTTSVQLRNYNEVNPC